MSVRPQVQRQSAMDRCQRHCDRRSAPPAAQPVHPDGREDRYSWLPFLSSCSRIALWIRRRRRRSRRKERLRSLLTPRGGARFPTLAASRSRSRRIVALQAPYWPPSVVSILCPDKWEHLNWGGQRAVHKLGLAQTERPVGMPVGHHRNDQILRPHAAFSLQPLRQFGVHGNLLLIRSALLEDLNDHNAVRAIEAEAGVLGDDLTLVVLGDDLISITRRRRKDIEHDVLDGVSQPAHFLRRPTLKKINTNEWHEHIYICYD